MSMKAVVMIQCDWKIAERILLTENLTEIENMRNILLTNAQ